LALDFDDLQLQRLEILRIDVGIELVEENGPDSWMKSVTGTRSGISPLRTARKRSREVMAAPGE